MVSRTHLFSLQYGPIKDIRMATDPEGHSKGFAFVEFEEEVSSFVTRQECR